MSSIYMVQQDISFADLPLLDMFPNKLIKQSAFSFPSNVIGCCLTLSSLGGLRSIIKDGVVIESAGTWTCFGAGIQDVSYLGSQVYFTAWMQLLCFDGGGFHDGAGYACPITSRLTIQAIAQCE
jgi:hypothetical protein